MLLMNFIALICGLANTEPMYLATSFGHMPQTDTIFGQYF